MGKIPTITRYHVKGEAMRTTKEPLYRLKSQAEEMKYQEELGKFLPWYYGVDLPKCCGVYPRFLTDQSFEDNGFFVCLVCGRESKHLPMTWQAREAWKEALEAGAPRFRQMTIEELLESR